MKNGFKVIDIEHHYETERMMQYMIDFHVGCPVDGALIGVDPSFYGKNPISRKLGEERIAVLDKEGIDFAQLSLTTPGTEFFPVKEGKEIAVESNDLLGQAISEHPDRFGAWMSLVPDDPEWSLKEMDRCLGMGLYGWMSLSNFNGHYLDEPKYWPLLEKAEATGMPIYIHPFFPPNPSLLEFGYCISGPTFGFMVDASTCFLRMVYRGVFDRFPGLKIVLGHDGEAFPFLKNRIDTAYRQGSDRPNRRITGERPQHCPSYYLDRNVWITTSGNYLPEALRCCVGVMPKDRVMMSTDFPYEDAGGMIDLVAGSEFLTREQRQAMLYDNARALGFGK